MATTKSSGKRAKTGQLTASNATSGESAEEVWKSREKIIGEILAELKAIGVDAIVSDFREFGYHQIVIDGMGGSVFLRVSPYTLKTGPFSFSGTPFYEVCVCSGRRQTYSPKVDWKCSVEGKVGKTIFFFVSPPNVRKIAERIKRDLEAIAVSRRQANEVAGRRGELLQHASKLNEIAGRNVVGVESCCGLGPQPVRFVVSLRHELTAEDVERIVNAGIVDLLKERLVSELKP